MLDDLDCRVLAAVIEDGRATLRDVAQRADLPTATVAERVQALEDRGVVTGYVPRIDYAELGYEVTAVFSVSVNPKLLPTARRRLVEERTLVSVYEVAGDHDIVAIGRYRDAEAVDEQRRGLWGVPGVTAVSVSVADAVHADHEHPPLCREEEEEESTLL